MGTRRTHKRRPRRAADTEQHMITIRTDNVTLDRTTRRSTVAIGHGFDAATGEEVTFAADFGSMAPVTLAMARGETVDVHRSSRGRSSAGRLPPRPWTCRASCRCRPPQPSAAVIELNMGRADRSRSADHHARLTPVRNRTGVRTRSCHRTATETDLPWGDLSQGAGHPSSNGRRGSSWGWLEVGSPMDSGDTAWMLIPRRWS